MERVVNRHAGDVFVELRGLCVGEGIFAPLQVVDSVVRPG